MGAHTDPERQNVAPNDTSTPHSPHTSTASSASGSRSGNTATTTAEGMPLVTFKMRSNGIYFIYFLPILFIFKCVNLSC